MKLFRLTAVLLIGVLLGDAGVLGGLTRTAAESADPPTSIAESKLYEDRLRAKVPTTYSNFTVGYYGDSFGFEASEHAHHLLDTGGRLRAVGASFHGVAVCDLLPTMRSDAARHEIFGAILMFSGTAFTPCMARPGGGPLRGNAALRKFEADLTEAVVLFSAEGARVYLGTVPESRLQAATDDTWSARVRRIVARVADKYPRAELVDSAASVLNAKGEYTDALPCLEFEPCIFGKRNLVRESTGVHFCTSGFSAVPVGIDTCPVWSSGAFRFAAALTAPVIEDAQRRHSKQARQN